MKQFIPEIIISNSKFTKLGNEARLNLKYVPYGNIFLNKTATKIYELCDGTCSMNDIIETISELYPTIPRKKIELDIISIIRQFYNMGIIKWKKDNYFSNDMVYEDERSKIQLIWVDNVDEEICVEYENSIVSPYVNESVFFQNEGLPYKIFNGELMMLVFYDKNSNEKAQLLVSFDRSDQLLTINSLKYNADNEYFFNKMFTFVEKIISINRNEETDLSYVFYVNENKNVDILKKFGFIVNSIIHSKIDIFQCIKL